MTEAEWLAGSDPAALFVCVRETTSDRKVRLYLCAGCRTIWHLLAMNKSQEAVEVAEQFADGFATIEDLHRANYHAEADCFSFDSGHHNCRAAWLAFFTTYTPGWFTEIEQDRPFGFSYWIRSRFEDMKHYSWPWTRLFHDIFGNPFRPVTLNPSWLTSTVIALATGIYDEKAFDRMPILADALQDAGCDNEEMLNHCRGENVHVKGCFVVDLLTGRE